MAKAALCASHRHVHPRRESSKTRILVLEEHPLLRHGIIDYLNSQPDMIVCGETDNIQEARNKIAECKPRLLLTALRLGAGDSLGFVKALKGEQPALLILVYSAFEEAIFAERALRAGADGYMMKKAPKEELLVAIRDVLSGNIYVSRDLAMRAFKNRSSRGQSIIRRVLPLGLKSSPIARCTFSIYWARGLAISKSLFRYI